MSSMNYLRGPLLLALSLCTGAAWSQSCETFDPETCTAALYEAAPAQLQRWCEQGAQPACSRLLSEWRSEARRGPPADHPDLQEPDVCKEDHAAYNASACQDAARAALGKAMAMAVAGVFNQPDATLSAEHRATLQQLCLAHPGGDFCGELAEEHWKAGQWSAAVEALGAACRSGDGNRCDLYTPLQALGDQLQPQAATALPCGDYRANGGLVDELNFSGQGLVGIGLGSQLRARLEDGAIHVRHDRGGDFVFMPLPGGALVGMGDWVRMRLYQREGGASQCDAAPSFDEVPLSSACPEGGTLQECNAAGNRAALSGQWDAAAEHYLGVCRSGAREGCQNLISAYENGAGLDVQPQLQQLCDGNARHVACDLLATTQWGLLQAGRELQRAVEQPRARHSNQKGK